MITNIDADHLDYYGSMKRLTEAFKEFANRVSFYGKVFLCTECERVRKIVPKVYKRKATYGFKDADFTAENVELQALGQLLR